MVAFDQKLMTTADMCATLQVHRVTLCRMLKSGRVLEGSRFGRQRRWNPDEVKRWIDAGCPTREKWEQMKAS